MADDETPVEDTAEGTEEAAAATTGSDDSPETPETGTPEAGTTEAEAAGAEEPGAEEATEAAEVPAEEQPPTILPEHEGVLERIRAGLGDGVVDAVSNHGDLVVRVTRESWHRAAEVARERLDCEYVSFISAIDWMPRPAAPTEDPDAPSIPTQPQEMTTGVAGGDTRFQVFACVQSTDDRVERPDGPGPTVQVIFKTDVDEGDLRVASWTDVYPGADWHERECWEMYGVTFEGHPHLRHLYLPGEFEGHPLRKDFPLLSREVKPWPGLVDVELMPGGDEDDSGQDTAAARAGAPTGGGGDEESPGQETA